MRFEVFPYTVAIRTYLEERVAVYFFDIQPLRWLSATVMRPLMCAKAYYPCFVVCGSREVVSVNKKR
jgi:hypothetical protein